MVKTDDEERVIGSLLVLVAYSGRVIACENEVIVNLLSRNGRVSHGNDKSYYKSEDATKAFDGYVLTKWSFVRKGLYPWIAWTFDGGDRVIGNVYDISTADNTPECDPKHWRIDGSLSGESWDLLDERDDQFWSH